MFQRRVAEIAIDPAALRNQGAPGVAKTAREFLATLDFLRFARCGNQSVFAEELDRQTDLLKNRFPEGAQHWGTARKALNLFLEEAYYHRFLCEAYGLERIEEFLEVPLDSQVADFLKRRQKNNTNSCPVGTASRI